MLLFCCVNLCLFDLNKFIYWTTLVVHQNYITKKKSKNNNRTLSFYYLLIRQTFWSQVVYFKLLVVNCIIFMWLFELKHPCECGLLCKLCVSVFFQCKEHFFKLEIVYVRVCRESTHSINQFFAVWTSFLQTAKKKSLESSNCQTMNTVKSSNIIVLFL